ncbi:MAG TPA: hypothetical protein VFU86_07705, partial [Terriglobales bacterium]|nr:hypothetical protein [Terriglobales bacterium]
ILRMASNFETLLRDAVTNPEKRVSALQMQSVEELQKSEEEKNARKQNQRKKLMSAAPKKVDITEKG